MSLLFNILCGLVITFLPRSKGLLISWLQSPSAVILEPKSIKSVTVSIVSQSICHEVFGPDTMILVFWTLSFKLAFSLSSFTFIKRLFSYLLSAIRVVSSAYLRLLIVLPAILIPACASSNPAFLMMYSAYKLNKQGDNIQPWGTPFPVWDQFIFPCSSSNCCFLTCIQISQEAGLVFWYSHLFKNFPEFVVVHTKTLAYKVEVDVFWKTVALWY